MFLISSDGITNRLENLMGLKWKRIMKRTETKIKTKNVFD